MDLKGYKIKRTPTTPNRKDGREHELATTIWEHGGKHKPFMSVYMKVRRLGFELAYAKWAECKDSANPVGFFMTSRNENNE
jgi:hypothetical protein